MFYALDKGDPNLDFDTLFFSFEWKLPELWELKEKKALYLENGGFFELHLLMHRPKCTFYS